MFEEILGVSNFGDSQRDLAVRSGYITIILDLTSGILGHECGESGWKNICIQSNVSPVVVSVTNPHLKAGSGPFHVDKQYQKCI